MTAARHENWMWIELLAFDNESPDYGVGEFLARAGSTPQALLLFLYSVDFVNAHDGMEPEWTLPPYYCSYAARPFNQWRELQPWTNLQLKGLVAELRRQGVAVYCSVMHMFAGEGPQGEWGRRHAHLAETLRDGASAGVLNPLRRLPDGSFYEDFLRRQVLRVLADYGFDGFHAADGLSSPRRPVYEADYSDDMVDQFLGHSGLRLPAGLAAQAEGDAAAMTARADWIWGEHRLEWIRFYADRWAGYARQLTTGLHEAGYLLAWNNTWTRDPLQSLYRYGVDYRQVMAAGVDTLVAETVAAGVSTGAEGVADNPHYDFLAMAMLMQAYAPGAQIRCLNGTRDATEQWDVLRHARPALEREIYSLANLYRVDAAGRPQRCSRGPVFCLATDVEADEWRWLQGRLALGFDEAPAAISGATLLWSDAAFAAQLPDFVATRRPTVHKLAYELMKRGAPLHAVARVEDLAHLRGTLLVLRPDLLPAAEQAALAAYQGGPVVQVDSTIPEATDDTGAQPTDLSALAEPRIYPEPLYFRPLAEAFLRATVERIVAACPAARVVTGQEWAAAWTLELADGRRRVLLSNDSACYVRVGVDMGQEIASLRVVTEFPCTRLTPDGSQFSVRVPGRGMVIVDVTLG